MRFIVFLFILILPTFGWTQDFAEFFKEGTQHYTAKEYDKARDAFAKAIEKDPNNATALTNLALAQFQLGNKALAVGLLRKVLTIDPELATAQAGLKFALKQIDLKDLPHQIETYESVHAKLLAPIPVWVYLILTALFLFITGWTFLTYMGRRRQALSAEKAPPSPPLMGFVFALALICSLGLLSLKLYDSTIVRATIIEDRVSMQTAPGESQVALLDLSGGMEVIVKSTEKEWSQITYPGSLTGWIKSSSLIVTSGQ